MSLIMKTIFSHELKAGDKFELGGQDYEIVKVENITNDVDAKFIYIQFILSFTDPIPENGHIMCLQHGLMFDIYL